MRWVRKTARLRDELDAREADLNRREDAIFRREVELAQQRADLLNARVDLEEKEEKRKVVELLKADPITTYNTIGGPFDRNDCDLQDGWCAYCESYATCTAYKMYWAETKRVRKQYLCSDECAFNFDETQRELVDGEAYVRKSLGVE